MLLDEKEVEALRKGAFRLDCLEMKLERKTPDASYAGAGQVYQDEDGRLALRMLIPGNRQFGSGRAYPVGDIIPEAAYFTLTAKDMRGRTWTAGWVLPSFEHSAPGGGSFATGLLRDLTTTDELPPGRNLPDSLRLIYFDDLEFPANARTSLVATSPGSRREQGCWNSADFEVAGMRFVLTREADQSTVVATAGPDSFPPLFRERVTEALQFVLEALPTEALVRQVTGRTETVALTGEPPERLRPHLTRAIPLNFVGARKPHRCCSGPISPIFWATRVPLPTRSQPNGRGCSGEAPGIVRPRSYFSPSGWRRCSP
jgi:hypothetical protein